MTATASMRERFGQTVAESIYDNPVVTRDFRSRMRGRKAFLVMGGYVLLLAAVLLIAFYTMWEQYFGHGTAYTAKSNLGRDLFVALTWTQTLLLTLIIPSLSSGALSQEIEKRTIEMLVLTPLSPRKIVLGKQLSAFLYTLVLVVCSVPLSGICLMLGGISPAEIAVTYILVMSWALLLTCFGVMCSSLNDKTANASGSAFGVSIAWFIYSATHGTIIYGLSFLMSGMRVGSGAAYPRGMLESPFAFSNPVWTPMGAMVSAKVCGVGIPVALTSFLYNAVHGALFLLIASTHVKYLRVEGAKPVRLLLLGSSVFTTFCAMGNTMSIARGVPSWFSATNYLATMLLWSLPQWVILAAMFATGEIKKRPGQSMLTYAFSFRKAFKSDVGGAISYMLFFVVAEYAALGVAAALGIAPAQLWPVYFAAGLVIVIYLFALCGIGILFSSAVRTRRTAAFLVVLFAVALHVLNVVGGVGTAGRGVPSDGSPFAVLSPSAAIRSMVPMDHNAVSAVQAAGPVPTGSVVGYSQPPWPITCLLYLVIGFVALLLADPIHARTGGVKEQE